MSDKQQIAVLEQKLAAAKAKCARLADRLAQARLAMSELCDAITARLSSEEVNGDNILRLFLAYDAARKALELK